MSSRAPGTDEELAVAAAGGSRSAFEELVLRYGGALLALLERRLGDAHQALDLGQDVWVRVFRSLARFRPEQSFRAWLFAIALNAARDEGRRRARHRLVLVDADVVELVARDASAAGECRALVELALERVPEPFQSALVLVDREGLSYAEAARALACAVGTVKSRVSRGRLVFRDQWTRLTGEVERGSAASERGTAASERGTAASERGTAARGAP